MGYKIIHGDCTKELERLFTSIDLTFKEYLNHNDNLPDEVYWQWMREVCSKIYSLTSNGGAIYFMQLEKNTEQVLSCLRESGWDLQNLIIWKKKTSVVPCNNKFGKHFNSPLPPIIQLLLRIILSSTMPLDTVLDPFTGTGTTLVVAEQLGRNSIGIEKNKENVKCIEWRLKIIRESDDVQRFYGEYIYTKNLDKIWGYTSDTLKGPTIKQLSIYGTGR